MTDLGNDQFANAYLLPTSSVTGTVGPFTNQSYTLETGEQYSGGSSAWFIWYPDPSLIGTTVAVDTHGSNYDTKLAVYSAPLVDTAHLPTAGYTVANITMVASNDDANGQPSLVGGTLTANESRVTFVVAASTMYFIQHEGYSTNTSASNYLNYQATLVVAPASSGGGGGGGSSSTGGIGNMFGQFLFGQTMLGGDPGSGTGGSGTGGTGNMLGQFLFGESLLGGPETSGSGGGGGVPIKLPIQLAGTAAGRATVAPSLVLPKQMVVHPAGAATVSASTVNVARRLTSTASHGVATGSGSLGYTGTYIVKSTVHGVAGVTAQGKADYTMAASSNGRAAVTAPNGRLFQYSAMTNVIPTTITRTYHTGATGGFEGSWAYDSNGTYPTAWSTTYNAPYDAVTEAAGLEYLSGAGAVGLSNFDLIFDLTLNQGKSAGFIYTANDPNFSTITAVFVDIALDGVRVYVHGGSDGNGQTLGGPYYYNPVTIDTAKHTYTLQARNGYLFLYQDSTAIMDMPNAPGGQFFRVGPLSWRVRPDGTTDTNAGTVRWDNLVVKIYDKSAYNPFGQSYTYFTTAGTQGRGGCTAVGIGQQAFFQSTPAGRATVAGTLYYKISASSAGHATVAPAPLKVKFGAFSNPAGRATVSATVSERYALSSSVFGRAITSGQPGKRWLLAAHSSGVARQTSSISYVRYVAPTTINTRTSLTSDLFKYKALAPTTINLSTTLTGLTAIPLRGTVNGSTVPSLDFHIYFPHISATVNTATTPSARLRMQYVMDKTRLNPIQGSTTFRPVYEGRPIVLAGVISPNTYVRGDETRPRAFAPLTIFTSTSINVGRLGNFRALSGQMDLSTTLTGNVIGRFGGTIITFTVVTNPIAVKVAFGSAATIFLRTDLKSHYTTYHRVPVDTPLGFVMLIDTKRGALDGENLFTQTSVTAPNLYSQRIRYLDCPGVATAASGSSQLIIAGFVSKASVSIPSGNDTDAEGLLHPVSKVRQHYV